MVRYEQDYKKQDIVFITGEVHYPGVYAIELGSTLGDIITKAGGYTKRANPSNIMVNNSSIKKIPDRELERILLIPEENRGQSERAYIKARALTIKGSIESNSMNQSKELMNFTLVNNDEIYVPENFNYIEILGGILKPGRYPFSNNRTFDEYIKLAGGKSRTATRDIFIIKSGTGQRLPANRDIIIENGDTIFIADKMEYNKWIILKDILTTLGSVATLIVVIQSVIGT
jgi:protein involved in polysaccharide export with SLBB domain